MTDAVQTSHMEKETHTPRRTIRVDDETWDAALEAAKLRGESLPEAIRKFLKRYAQSKH